MARERTAPETLTYEVRSPAKKKAKKKAAPAVKKGRHRQEDRGQGKEREEAI